jgi:UDP-N-acetylmuramoyl-L-alanyl-D-glutamate--2,6-diaminopimelate ligase
MTQIELNKALDGISDCSDSLSGEQVLGVSTNSKEIIPGFIFVAIKGTKFDGNDFIDEALDRGAICVISDSKDIKDTNQIIKVKNCRKVIGKISANLYDHPQKKIKIIGVTGTNGKTSTTLILKSILESFGKKVLQVGTLGVIPNIVDKNFGLTTPDSKDIFKILSVAVQQQFEFAIFEVSSHALSQNRIDNLEFDFTGFTNLTLDHLDYHGSIDSYFNEKKKLFGLVKIMDQA